MKTKTKGISKPNINTPEILGIRLSKDDKQILLVAAQKERMGMSSYVRGIVFRYINQNKNEGDI